MSISTHAPLAGRDDKKKRWVLDYLISTHAPLAGRDRWVSADARPTNDFNPRAPCGARPVLVVSIGIKVFKFQPTRPLRGATTT